MQRKRSEICVERRGSFLSVSVSPPHLSSLPFPVVLYYYFCIHRHPHPHRRHYSSPLLPTSLLFSLLLRCPILSPPDSFSYGYAMIPSPRLEAAIPTLTLSPTWRRGMSSDNIKGLVLALSSSLFIGASFIVKKKGLKKAASSGVRAGVGGYSYLYEPLWWVGMITMIAGEIANFAAYAYAPAILVTPLGALSIIISAALAHVILRERLHIFGILGCVLCVVGSATIILHAPREREIESVTEVWQLAMDPAFLLYAALVVATAVTLIIHFTPQYGQTHIMIYIGVCSLVGSLSVMSVKALGIALKLTLSGMNQLIYPQTWIFTLVVITCVLTQMNYLNKALDTFNTAVVSPIYYVMFTSLTILASVIMFKDWDRQSPSQAVTEICGFVTILSGTFLLHKTKDMADGSMSPKWGRASKQSEEDEFSDTEGIPLTLLESSRSP